MMKKSAKKSNHIIVDEYDKIKNESRKVPAAKLSNGFQNLNQKKYKIEEVICKYCQEYIPAPYFKEHQKICRPSICHKKDDSNSNLKRVEHYMYKNNNYHFGASQKPKMVDREINDYFPNDYRDQPQINNKPKRPMSAANKTYEHKANVINKPLKKQQNQCKLKKTISSSKFKEERYQLKNLNSKMKEQINVPFKTQLLHNKNQIAIKKYPPPLIAQEKNKLKKKNVNLASKPLKIDQFTHMIGNNRVKKLNSEEGGYKAYQIGQISKGPKNNQVNKSVKKYKETYKQQKKKNIRQNTLKQQDPLIVPHRQQNRKQILKASHIQRQKYQKNRISINSDDQLKSMHDIQSQEEFIEWINHWPKRQQQQKEEHVHVRENRPNQQVRERQRQRRRRNINTNNSNHNHVHQRRSGNHINNNANNNTNTNNNRNANNNNRQRQNRRQTQQRSNRNANYGHRRQNPSNNNPNVLLNFFSQTMNQQIQLMKQLLPKTSHQFNMMSNALSSFVNINIQSHNPGFYHFSTHQYDESDSYNNSMQSSLSSDYSSQYDDYYDGESQPQGLNSQQLNTIKQQRYNTDKHGNHQCTICLVQLKNEDMMKKLFCDHVFHSQCIDEWLKRKSACPVCRDKLA